jgi:hypothetical protein
MITDIQGTEFILTDPTIHTKEKYFHQSTDQGVLG